MRCDIGVLVISFLSKFFDQWKIAAILTDKEGKGDAWVGIKQKRVKI
jgi:hypothetical protein